MKRFQACWLGNQDETNIAFIVKQTNSKPSYFETILHPRASKRLKMRAELHKSRKTHVKHEEISRMGPKWSRGGL